MSLVSNLLDKHKLSATLAQADDFEDWLVKSAWSQYIDCKMNKRIIIENQINNLGLRFVNGTVRKEYNSEIEIPLDLVDDVWIESPENLETLGLKYEITEKKENNTVPESEVVIIEPGVESSDSSEIQFEKTDIQQPTGLIIRISGKPLQPGDYSIKLNYKHKGWINGEEISCLSLPIAFNPDPRSLWKNIPTPQDKTIFFKPDSEVGYVKVEETEASGPRKDIVAASQRGRSHAQEGKARDDHFKLYHCDESDWYIIAVADGAGSAKFSRQGSRIACDTVVAHCQNQLLDATDFEEKIRAYHDADDEVLARKQMANIIYNIIGNAAFKAHKAINEQAVETAKEVAGTKAKDFATTLMFAICKKFDFGWFVASYWVGDGAMCIFNQEKKTFKLLGVPDEGEFSCQTRFLTMPEIFKDAKAVMDRLRFSIEDDFTALMLMTDGVSDPMFETENNLNSYDKWEEFWNKLKTGFSDDEIPGVDLSDDNEASKDQLLQWMDFWSPGNHDDRTLAILY